MVHWENSSGETGDSQRGRQSVDERSRCNFMSDRRWPRGRGSNSKRPSTRSWNCTPLSFNYTDMADHDTGVSGSQNDSALFRDSQHIVHAAAHENRECAPLLQNNSVRFGTLHLDLHGRYVRGALCFLNYVTINFYTFLVQYYIFYVQNRNFIREKMYRYPGILRIYYSLATFAILF